MANWSILKTAITDIIRTNGNQEITGQVLQSVLTSMVNALGERPVFAGVATPTTAPGIFDGPIFFIAATQGAYPSFNNITLAQGEIAILRYNEGTWVKEPLLITATKTDVANLSKKVIESVDVSELDGLVAIPTPTNGKADYWLTKMLDGISTIIGRVFLFEDNTLHKVTQVVMSNQKIDDNYPDGSHAAEGLTVYYRFYGHNTVDVPLKQWTPWKKLYDSEDMSPDEIETAISELQLKDKEHDDELQVIGDRVTTEINSIRSSTPVFANIVAGDVDLELGSVISNYTVVYLENKKVFAALNAGKYWANWRAWGKYPSADSYGPAPAVGKVYIMGNALYVWNGSSLQEIGDFDDIKNNAQAIDLLAEEITSKAPKVGYAPDLKVDFAKELVGRGVAEPQEIGTIRPTGVISIGDGNATIEKVKGKSVVWNQISDTKNWINNGWEQGIQSYSYADGVLTIKTTTSGNYKRVGLNAPFLLARHKVLVSFSVRSNADFKEDSRGVGVRSGYNDVNGVFVNFTSSTTWASYACIVMKDSVEHNGCLGITYNVTAEQLANAGGELTLEFKDIVFYDLTQMFGAGNEPTTIEDFKARKPLGVSDDYNEGEIVSYDAYELKSIGFNAFNGTYAKVIGGQQYHALGTITSIGFTAELGGETTAITLDSEGMFTPSETGYVYAEGTDICIHLAHTYTPKHTTKYEEDVLRLPNIKGIKDKDGNQLFPYGLLSAGSVHDEITATKAIKRVGKRVFTEGDNEDSTVLTDGKETLFALATPTEVALPEPLNMTYDAWDFGTEELIADGKTTPLNADIVYQFNAVDRIRENTEKNKALEAELAELKAQLTQLTQVSNEDNNA